MAATWSSPADSSSHGPWWLIHTPALSLFCHLQVLTYCHCKFSLPLTQYLEHTDDAYSLHFLVSLSLSLYLCHSPLECKSELPYNWLDLAKGTKLCSLFPHWQGKKSRWRIIQCWCLHWYQNVSFRAKASKSAQRSSLWLGEKQQKIRLISSEVLSVLNHVILWSHSL